MTPNNPSVIEHRPPLSRRRWDQSDARRATSTRIVLSDHTRRGGMATDGVGRPLLPRAHYSQLGCARHSPLPQVRTRAVFLLSTGRVAASCARETKSAPPPPPMHSRLADKQHMSRSLVRQLIPSDRSTLITITTSTTTHTHTHALTTFLPMFSFH